MIIKRNTKVKNIYNFLIKTIIIVISYIYIYREIVYKEEVSSVLQSIKKIINSEHFLSILIIIIILMFTNWGIEAIKWKFLINKVEKVSYLKSLEAIFCGVTISTLLPNRTGEYFGRVFIFKKANRLQGILITIIGSISQLLITIILGLLSLVYFIYTYYYTELLFPVLLMYGMMFIITVIIVLLIFLYYNISILYSFIRKIKYLRRYKIERYIKVFSYYNLSELTKVLLLSLLRYTVFSFQFYLIIKLFHIETPVFTTLIFIILIFFVTTIIPSVSLSELGVRGTVCLYFFGAYYDKFGVFSEDIKVALIASTSCLWIINLILPALIGSIFILDLNFIRKNQIKNSY